MKITPTTHPDVLLIEPKVFGDARGFFCETFSQRQFDDAAGRHVDFVQDNHSRSSRGVLRGLHYQLAPHAQGKLVRCASGAVFDVAVDMRKDSPRFGQWVGATLTAENHHQLWIPPGFAHGFLVLSERAEFLYKCTSYYDPTSERALLWNDPAISIDWPLPSGIRPVVSTKDAAGASLADTESFS